MTTPSKTTPAPGLTQQTPEKSIASSPPSDASQILESVLLSSSSSLPMSPDDEPDFRESAEYFLTKYGDTPRTRRIIAKLYPDLDF
jgi:hypothetical protein